MVDMKESNPAGLQAINLALKAMDSVVGKVGWFPGAVYEDGTSVAYVATIQEFGVPEKSIPARPFMRPTIQEHTNEWRDTATTLAGKMVKGVITAEDVMGLLTIKAEADVAKTIESITSPPLSKITLGARKYRREGKSVTGKTIGEIARLIDEGKLDVSGVPDKPLDDTGFMLSTLTHTVEKK